MKKIKLILPMTLFAAALAGGCESQESSSVDASKSDASSVSEEAELEVTKEPVKDVVKTTKEESVVDEPKSEVVEEVVETVEPEAEVAVEQVEETVYVDVETAEEMPTPADELAQNTSTLLGTYTVTWYVPTEYGGNIGAMGVPLTDGYSVAMPDYALLGHTILIEGYGYYCVQDVSPSGIVDIFVNDLSEIPSYGMDTANVYLID